MDHILTHSFISSSKQGNVNKQTPVQLRPACLLLIQLSGKNCFSSESLRNAAWNQVWTRIYFDSFRIITTITYWYSSLASFSSRTVLTLLAGLSLWRISKMLPQTQSSLEHNLKVNINSTDGFSDRAVCSRWSLKHTETQGNQKENLQGLEGYIGVGRKLCHLRHHRALLCRQEVRHCLAVPITEIDTWNNILSERFRNRFRSTYWLSLRPVVAGSSRFTVLSWISLKEAHSRKRDHLRQIKKIA